MCRLFNQVTEPTNGNLNRDNAPHETPISRVPDAGTLSVALVQHEEYEFDGQNTKPLQIVMPTTPSCMTSSPPNQKISPGMTRMENKSTQYTPIKVHPLLKGRKLDEDDERLRRWVANGLMEKRQVVASYEGRQHLVLVREDICTLLRHWVNSNFRDDFYCIPPGILETVLQKRNLDSFREVPTVSYVGMGPHFGDDSRYFDKIAAFMRKWALRYFCSLPLGCGLSQSVSIVIGGCMPLRLLKKGCGCWIGRIIEDIAKVSMPAYEPTENGLPRFYPSVLKQHNSYDCSVYVIKFMQF
ncbi:uncharacterized protein DS421_13g427070 [Arachis hypogaea]|nr:uncharacterized protein DS421_13g427070 [Arachis hypogaea]